MMVDVRVQREKWELALSGDLSDDGRPPGTQSAPANFTGLLTRAHTCQACLTLRCNCPAVSATLIRHATDVAYTYLSLCSGRHIQPHPARTPRTVCGPCPADPSVRSRSRFSKGRLLRTASWFTGHHEDHIPIVTEVHNLPIIMLALASAGTSSRLSR